jgi:hypothetical protein
MSYVVLDTDVASLSFRKRLPPTMSARLAKAADLCCPPHLGRNKHRYSADLKNDLRQI